MKEQNAVSTESVEPHFGSDFQKRARGRLRECNGLANIFVSLRCNFEPHDGGNERMNILDSL